MPIGVPKVPYRLPGDVDAQWVDLYNRLYRERVLFLCHDLEDELANQLIGIIIYLSAEDDVPVKVARDGKPLELSIQPAESPNQRRPLLAPALNAVGRPELENPLHFGPETQSAGK